ncbi:hypothetical protein D3C80_1655580 [compost metagenome]
MPLWRLPLERPYNNAVPSDLENRSIHHKHQIQYDTDPACWSLKLACRLESPFHQHIALAPQPLPEIHPFSLMQSAYYKPPVTVQALLHPSLSQLPQLRPPTLLPLRSGLMTMPRFPAIQVSDHLALYLLISVQNPDL